MRPVECQQDGVEWKALDAFGLVTHRFDFNFALVFFVVKRHLGNKERYLVGRLDDTVGIATHFFGIFLR